MKVWLDDERGARDCWVRVWTPAEEVELLRGGEVDELSPCHELGLDVGAGERTGYDVLLWLQAEVAAGRAMTVHVCDVGAVNRIERAVGSIRRPAGEA